MAESPTHRFGQCIGAVLEDTIREPLLRIAERFGLYLDYKHPRASRNGLAKVRWTDGQGNAHDLDYVLEKGGSEEVTGEPKAFIEVAWRRYTKHSRNKAQEIQGAIGPLAERYSDFHPFLGVVLGGEFTTASITQLRSHGFEVLYFPMATIHETFDTVGIDSRFDESTPDSVVAKKVAAFERLSEKRLRSLVAELRNLRKSETEQFFQSLERSLGRRVSRVVVLALRGESFECPAVEDAVTFITQHAESRIQGKFVRYEIQVDFGNGDRTVASFAHKFDAIEFLRGLM